MPSLVPFLAFQLAEVLVLPVLEDVVAEGLVGLEQRVIEPLFPQFLLPEHLDHLLLVVVYGFVHGGHRIRI